MKVRAKYVFETEFDVNFLDEEGETRTLEHPLTEIFFDGGLSQYIKDYDPDMRYESPIEAVYVIGENGEATIQEFLRSSKVDV